MITDERRYQRYIANGYFRPGEFKDGQQWGPHGLWYEQDGRENYSKSERPYGYSPFFLFGDHESIKGAGCDYTDRYQLWDQDRFKRAMHAIGRECRWDQMTRAEFDRFVAAYYGKGTKCVGVVEWCNVSNGYPCWSIHFVQSPQGQSHAGK